jgi:hypothetical protein
MGYAEDGFTHEFNEEIVKQIKKEMAPESV